MRKIISNWEELPKGAYKVVSTNDATGQKEVEEYQKVLDNKTGEWLPHRFKKPNKMNFHK